jgi:hypothetical protein
MLDLKMYRFRQGSLDTASEIFNCVRQESIAADKYLIQNVISLTFSLCARSRSIRCQSFEQVNFKMFTVYCLVFTFLC